MAKLPANFVESAVATLDRLWVLAGALTTSDGARGAMRENLSQHLYAGDLGTLPCAHIIAMADHCHEPAQEALAEYIGTHIDQKRFDDLTPGLQDYAKRVLLRPQLPGYGRGNKIIDTWTRDVIIKFLVGEAMRRWRLRKKPAAFLVATLLKRRGIRPASTRQVLEIYDSHDTLGARVVAFMMSAVPDDEPPPAAGAV